MILDDDGASTNAQAFAQNTRRIIRMVEYVDDHDAGECFVIIGDALTIIVRDWNVRFRTQVHINAGYLNILALRHDQSSKLPIATTDIKYTSRFQMRSNSARKRMNSALEYVLIVKCGHHSNVHVSFSRLFAVRTTHHAQSPIYLRFVDTY